MSEASVAERWLWIACWSFLSLVGDGFVFRLAFVFEYTRNRRYAQHLSFPLAQMFRRAGRLPGFGVGKHMSALWRSVNPPLP